MGIAAGRAHLRRFVIERRPVASQNMAAGNDDIDFGGTGSDRLLDLAQAQVKRRQARRKPGRDGSDGNTTSNGLDRHGDHFVIDADRPGGQIGQAYRLQQISADR